MITIRATEEGCVLAEEFMRNELPVKLHPRNRSEAIAYLQEMIGPQRFIFWKSGELSHFADEHIAVAEIISTQKPDKNWAAAQVANAYPLEERKTINFR